MGYLRHGGFRRSPLPDFFIGAHAAVAGYQLMTPDRECYRAYLPTLALIAPEWSYRQAFGQPILANPNEYSAGKPVGQAEMQKVVPGGEHEQSCQQGQAGAKPVFARTWRKRPSE
jgi:hypothetical protein